MNLQLGKPLARGAVLAASWALLALAPILSAADPYAPGVANFHQVNDQVYRGAQPTPQGFLNLSKLGVKTILDLRDGEPDAREEKHTVEALGMRYMHIPLHPLSAPSNEQIAQTLVLLEAAGSGPVFVHCKRGADRTGAVIACYRMEHDRWTNDKALAEAKSYGMSPFQRSIMHYILHYQPGPAPTVIQAADQRQAKDATTNK